MNIYRELNVKRKTRNRITEIRGTLEVLTILMLMMALFLNKIFFILSAILLILYFAIRSNTEIEFDYMLDNNELDIDKIISKSRRKRVLNIKLSQIVMCTSEESVSLEEFEKNAKKDFSSGDLDAERYAIIYHEENMRKVVLLNLEGEFLEEFRKLIPSKMF